MTSKTVPMKIEKRISKAFGKRVFLLGVDTYGYTVWLEEAKWDCGWYWAFGYIERYTNKTNPDRASDISSHTHWDTGIVGKFGSDYVHHINDNPDFVSTTLTENEAWKLSEYMKSFYILTDMAAYCKYGAHISTDSDFKTQPEMEKKINEEILPELFKKVYALLTPKETK